MEIVKLGLRNVGYIVLCLISIPVLIAFVLVNAVYAFIARIGEIWDRALGGYTLWYSSDVDRATYLTRDIWNFVGKLRFWKEEA